jgi:hypothetical protein
MRKQSAHFLAALKRQKRKLTIASAAVVFISFVLKEEIGEHVKGKLASVNGAAEQINKNAAQGIAGDQIYDINRKLDDALALLRGSEEKNKYEAWRNRIMEQPMLHRRTIEQNLSCVYAVQFVLPGADEFRKRAREISSQETKQISVPDRIRHEAALTPDDRNQLQEVDRQLDKLLAASWRLQDDVFRELSAQLQKKEREAAIVKWAGDAFFSLGWAIGFGLSLLGEPPKSD